jgi:hypothetical protein
MALKVRENPLFLWKMSNPIIQCRNQLCPLRMALMTRLFSPIRWKWTLISPNPVSYLRRAQMLSLFCTHQVQSVEVRLFAVNSTLYAALDSFVDVLSSALLIVVVDSSRISALTRILPGHQYVQSGRYRVTLEDLTCPSRLFSEFHHQAPSMFVHPQILMPRDVSDCEILCSDPALIPTMALLQPSRLIFFFLKKQFDRIRSTVPVLVSSGFNFH